MDRNGRKIDYNDLQHRAVKRTADEIGAALQELRGCVEQTRQYYKVIHNDDHWQYRTQPRRFAQKYKFHEPRYGK